MPTSVVVHGHFYQPPRVDPWTHRISVEPSAAPFHDWNERILAECYQPLTRVPLFDGEGRVRSLVNAFEWMSWDAGATLTGWLAREAPATLAALIEADRGSRARLGFGNALAAPYHHVILPLASPRDRITEIRWGLRDFRRRFGRDAEGFWLPETAVDRATLEALAAEGVAFTVLAPHQIEGPPTGGLAGRVELDGGRSIAIFAYDGALSHGVAFGEVLRDAWRWVDGLARAAEAPERRVIALATDGETFGHHHAWGDLALGAALARIDAHTALRLDNFAALLHRHPPKLEIEVIDATSWSCSHGIERWRSDCGCRARADAPGSQQWRGPLRETLEGLAEAIHGEFVRGLKDEFDDPWALRNAWIDTWGLGPDERLAWIRAHARRPFESGEAERVLTLLEAEHDALRMFTSCGWFFDELAGLETVQVMRYAAHALDLVGGARAAELERAVLEGLARAEQPGPATGADVWRQRVRGPDGGVREHVPGASGSSDSRGGTGHVPVYARDEASLIAAVRRFVRVPTGDGARELLEEVPRPRVYPGEMGEARARFVEAVERGALDPEVPIVREVALALGFSADFQTTAGFGGATPLPFVFGLHLHQPLGNFDTVFESHTDEVYWPLLVRLIERGTTPLTLHISGPLLEWLEARRHRLLDHIGRAVADGAIEVIASGLYEPVLPVLPRRERVEQVEAMRARIRRRFGVEARGLWLTERVWEPDLAVDLSRAGIDWAFVDDRHIRITGVPGTRVARPWRAVAAQHRITLLPIDEQLRYLVPFRPVRELEQALRNRRAVGASLALVADDGEKFGGWPGTRRWVWDEGWIEAFCDTIERLGDERVIELVGGSGAVDRVPAEGPLAPGSASYLEMEEWALPPTAAQTVDDARALLLRDPAGHAGRGFVRGGHWRHFFARYSESARMQLQTDRLQALARDRDAAPEVLDLLARARCNDAYWHGVFGGLYLPHLRRHVWSCLAGAEARLRAGQPITAEECEGVGGPELRVHGARFSAALALHRGGALVEYVDFEARRNLADVVTRRRERYHRLGSEGGPGIPSESSSLAGGVPSIHELEGRAGGRELPPFDAEDRAMTAVRIVSERLTSEAWREGRYDPVRSWVGERAAHRVIANGTEVVVQLSFENWGSLRTEMTFSESGTIRIRFRWDPVAFPPDALFALEWSLAHPAGLRCDPEPLMIWRYDICTTSRSEAGPESQIQGESVAPMWPVSLGRCMVELDVCGVARAGRGGRDDDQSSSSSRPPSSTLTRLTTMPPTSAAPKPDT